MNLYTQNLSTQNPAPLHGCAEFGVPANCSGADNSTRCVLCGKKDGGLRFKGKPLCHDCLQYAKTVL
ncbi:MAG: hypothetical protein LBT26_11070 [Clostridiales Family XIII bacterium]|jgi:hypothetical protein|nr:hypothetical protein [Clostridiales Family XIII bacterium]